MRMEKKNTFQILYGSEKGERKGWGEQSILSIPVLISRDCDGSGGHMPVIESGWITNLCLCSAGLSGCLMKITPHTGLIYFNQIWPKPDKCSIPPLCSSILCPLCLRLPPSCRLNPALLCHSSPLVLTASQDEKSFSPHKTIKVTFSLSCQILILRNP